MTGVGAGPLSAKQGTAGAMLLQDRRLMVVAYRLANRTLHRLGPLFGVHPAGAYRAIDTGGPCWPWNWDAPVRQIMIVDGALVPS